MSQDQKVPQIVPVNPLSSPLDLVGEESLAAAGSALHKGLLSQDELEKLFPGCRVVVGFDEGNKEDVQAIIRAIRHADGKVEIIDFDYGEDPAVLDQLALKDKNIDAMLKRRMSPMDMTRSMIGGVARHELSAPMTPGAGGWREQPSKTRSKAEREKRRKVKAARNKNRKR